MSTEGEYTEDFDELEGDTSPSDLSTTSRVVTVEPTTSALTVNVEMKRGTDYAKESKTVSTYLKVALPDTAVIVGADGIPVINPGFLSAVAAIGKSLLAVSETACAIQHGLEVVSDAEGVVRVTNLFGAGVKSAPGPAAPAVAPGPFTAPAAAPAPVAPVAPQAPQGGPAEPFPTAPPNGAAPAGPGGFPKSDNPAAWSNIGNDRKNAIMAALGMWVAGQGSNGEMIENKMVAGERYPKVVVGGTNVSIKMLCRGQTTPENVKAWANGLVASGVVAIPAN